MVGKAFCTVVLCIVSTMSLSAPVSGQEYVRFDARTGHYYEPSFFNGLWTQCTEWAQQWQRLGRPGYLATIKDATENELVRQVIHYGFVNVGISAMWIGGFKTYHLTPRWEWVTGQSFQYTSWGPFEPNNNGGRERFIEMFADGYWNDAQDANPTAGGYAVIEYEPSQVVVSALTGPTSVNSPATANYTITLSAPAPAEGAILFLYSNLASFNAMPLSVTFGAGEQTKVVSFSVPQIASQKSGTINVFGKAKKSLGVTVTP